MDRTSLLVDLLQRRRMVLKEMPPKVPRTVKRRKAKVKLRRRKRKKSQRKVKRKQMERLKKKDPKELPFLFPLRSLLPWLKVLVMTLMELLLKEVIRLLPRRKKLPLWSK
jgi:hypothetical protein